MKNLNTLTLLSLSSVIAALILSIFILISFGFLPKKLPLFYSLPWGEEQLAIPQQLLIIPALIICISLTNLIISWQLHQSQHFFKLTLIVTLITASLILIISFLKIFFIFI